MLAIIASLKKVTFCMKLPQEILVPVHHVAGNFVVAQFLYTVNCEFKANKVSIFTISLCVV